MANLTIKDIARISGCSVSTISRVINDRPDVRPETKEHVLKVMREAGFVPNTNARQLKIQQSRSLVFVVKGTRNIFFSDFLVQLQRAGDDHHCSAQRADRAAKHRAAGTADRAWLPCPDRDLAAGIAAGRKRKGNLNFVFPPSKDGEYIVDL